MNNPAMMYLFSAFAVVWFSLFVYMLYVQNRMNSLQQQVEFLLEERAEQEPARSETRRAASERG